METLPSVWPRVTWADADCAPPKSFAVTLTVTAPMEEVIPQT